MSPTTACWKRIPFSGAAVAWSLAVVFLLAVASPSLNACDGGTAVADPGSNPGLVADCKVLIAIRDELAGSGSLNWDTQLTMTSWQGVSVLGSPSRVTYLALRGDYELTGEIPAELGQLTQLIGLLLDRNKLTGEIPVELAQLSQLEVLTLDRNKLTGPIPPELAQLSQLKRLDLRNNHLMGAIPVELAQLSNLEYLDLSSTRLTGEIPVELAQLSQLQWLALGDQLTGEIPVELSELSQLSWLVLGPNQLTGEIPVELSQLSQLSWLVLDRNQLTGPIPMGLAQLSNLEYLTLGGNQLTGEIPPGLSQLSQLRWLYLHDNQLKGEIPPGLSQLSQLVVMMLYTNQLTGEIPPGLGQLTRLQRLGLDRNQLTGEIPPGLGQLTRLEGLGLSINQLTGEIPPGLGQLTRLQRLGLSINQLTGEIPMELAQLTQLQLLSLRDNQLTGPIPPELGQLTQLQLLSLDHNQLTGPIPPELGRLTELYRLGLDRNQLTGPIPRELGQLTNLQYLHLQHNQLTGKIPAELGRLSNLEEFSFRGNRLTGPLPPELSHLPDVYVLNLDAVWVGSCQMKMTWDDSGDPGVSYEYRWSSGSGRVAGPNEGLPLIWTDWVEISETMLRAGAGVRIEWVLTGLPSDVKAIQIRARSSNGNGFSPHAVVRVKPLQTAQPRLDFAHFANGDSITSDLVLVNVTTCPIRPALYFYDQAGNPIAPESVVDLTSDLEVTEDGALSVRTEIAPLGGLTISTHGREEVVSGSVKVVSEGPIGGVLRFNLPGIGVAGVGASQPLRDAIFPARRQAGRIRTAAAIRNLEEEELVVSCRLMKAGVVLEEVDIDLGSNGHDGRFIEEVFTATDTSNFVGSVRCTAEGEFTGVAVELDAGNQIFTTLPVAPVDRTEGTNKEATLDFAHFANGTGITSDLVFVNVAGPRRVGPFTLAGQPIRPALYFYDKRGRPIDPESVVDLTGDLEVTEDGALTVQTALGPLGELTISTHGRGELVSGSVKVVSDGPIGGFLRFSLPGIGVAGVGASQPVRDAIFPARRQAGGISTAAAIHNLGEELLVVSCQLMKDGAVLEEKAIVLEANGQDAQYIQQMFTSADTSDFVGSVRCTAPGEGRFTGVAVELDAGNRIFTTLPVVPVQR